MTTGEVPRALPRASPDSPELQLELTCDAEPIAYCEACWARSSAAKRTDGTAFPGPALLT